MSISAALNTYRLILKASPQFTADTLAEIQPAVDADPATYEGQYFVALDQPAGQQLYYVETGVVIPAGDVSGYKFELDDDRHYNGDGTLITAAVGTQWFSATTDAAGQVVVHATSDGTAGGTALFSSIKSVSIEPDGIATTQEDRVYAGGYTIANGKSVTAQVLRGATVLIGGQTTRSAGAGVLVRVAVEGVLA